MPRHATERLLSVNACFAYLQRRAEIRGGRGFPKRQLLKYVGKDKGVSVVTFIDMRDFMWHSTVISASEREAVYRY